MTNRLIDDLKVVIYSEDGPKYIVREPTLFGDFRNALEDMEEGGEGKLRNYEDLLDYKAVYHIFNEVLNFSFNL